MGKPTQHTNDRLTAADFEAIRTALGLTLGPETQREPPSDAKAYERYCRDFWRAIEGAVRDLPLVVIRAYTGYLAQTHDLGDITCNDLTDWYVKYATDADRCLALKRALGV